MRLALFALVGATLLLVPGAPARAQAPTATPTPTPVATPTPVPTPARYTLTTSASPADGGTISDGGTYDDGTEVTVTATPRAGYAFGLWAGDCSGSGACTVTMTADRSVTARFVRIYALITFAAPPAGGSVSGDGTYVSGTEVAVTATPNSGYVFDRWVGDCTGSGACSVAMTANRSVTAHFVRAYTLATSVSPSGSGSVSGGGAYGSGTDVTVTATANRGYAFERWSGDCTGSGACSVTVTADSSVTAHFVRAYTVHLRVQPLRGGTATGGGTYVAGTRVTITATPKPGYRFDIWGGRPRSPCYDRTPTGSSCTFTLNGPRIFQVRFLPVFTLTTTADPAGGGTVTGGGTYDSGSDVTVTATPNSGYRFDRWSGDCTGSGACSVNMSAARSVTAHFVARYALAASASPSGGGSVMGGGTYDDGTDVTVTATANSGYRFDRWTGACTGSGTCSVTMNAARSVTAHFVRRYTLTTSAEPADKGSVIGGGTYDDGTEVTVTASPASGYRLDRWSGACTGSGTCTVTMSAARSVIAHFEVIPTYALTTFAAPPAGGTISGGGTYQEGTAVTVTATPGSGYVFARWFGACTGDGACSVTMNGNRSVTARFVRTYALTVSASPSGGGSVSGGGTYNSGAVVAVTATPGAGYAFDRWSGDCTGSGACSVTMNAPRSVTAHFVRAYALTVTASPSAGGSVSGGGTYDSGTNVTVTATANSGYRFDRWSGDCTGTGTCSVTMSAARSVTAHFVARYVLTAGASPSGGGSVTGSGTYDSGTNVTVTATANSGYRFDRWSGDCTGSGTCSVTMSATRSVTAHFVARYVLTANASPSGGGSVSGGGTYDAGARVTVTASPNSGYRFDRWSGACTGSGSCSVTMNAARSVTAHFVRRYVLTASASPSGGGSVSGGGTYDAGTNVTVTASPISGYRFDRWSGACTGSGACSVTMSAARSVTAHFVVIPTYVLTTFAAPPAGGTVSGGGAYNEGTAVTVTATANSGYAFDRWLGACTGSGACSVTMSANRSVTARFVRTYVLTTSASPSGGGSVSGGGTYSSGTDVTVTATANSGYRFDRWSGACTGTGACSVAMTAARSVTAHFTRTYTLTTAASPSGGGTVSGGGTHDSGTDATVTATANSGYRFDRWSGACTGTGTCSVTMNANRSVTAHFIARYALTTSASPSGGGTVSGGGTYDSGSDVTVTATANSGYRFDRWSGACTGTGACSVSMNAARSVTAHFIARYALTTSASPSGGGSVSGGGTYDAGSDATVTATANSGYRFDRWSGACTGSGACSVTMSAARSVTAHFARTYVLTTSASPSGGGSVSGGGTHSSGTDVTVTATPNRRYRFDRWSGACTGTGTCSVTMTADRSVTAHFVRQYTVHLRVQPHRGGTVTGAGTYDAGTRVTITATPKPGYGFDIWGGRPRSPCYDRTLTGSSCTFTLNGPRIFQVRFLPVFTLTTTADPSGGGTVTGGGTYFTGTDVTVTANPNSGYRFDRWSGDCTGSGTCSVTMSEARSVTAHFVRTWTLTATADPSGGGTVTGGGTYDDGTDVTVTATPNAGYRFVRWAGDCTGTGTCSVAMTATRSVTAHFVARYTLTTSVSPSGGGTVSAGGVHDDGTDVTVTATPTAGYRFVRWAGDCTGTGTCTVTMSADRTVTAVFVRTWTLTASVSPAGGGTVSGGGTYDAGTRLPVTATPNDGYRFDRWSGDCTGSGVCIVTMSADRSVTAHFVRTYVLTASASPAEGGTVSGGGTYDTGTNVTVTASPNTGYRFDRWAGDCTGTGACSLAMSADRSVTAHFVARHTLTTSVSPAGGGTVSAGGTYDDGTEVTVTATANLGYRFQEWSGACLGTGACTVTMNADRSVTAVFVAGPVYNLIARAQPAAGGTVTGGGRYNGGANVTVTATANSGYRFSHWTGGACSGSGACSVGMTRNRVVIAVFVARYTLTTTASPSGGGTVTGGGTYDSRTNVAVTATPNPGYALERWSGACTGTGTCSVTMTADRSVTAHFVRTYTLTTTADPSGGGTLTGGGAYNTGTVVSVTATPNSGYRFDRWSGDCTGTGACTVTMTADRSVTAHFVRTYTLTASASPSGGGSVSGGGVYDTGANATVTASPNSGYRFVRWSGDCTGSGTCSVTMSADRSVTAHFVRTYTVHVRAQPLVGGTVTGGGVYDDGTRVTIAATPEAGYRFQAWSGGCGTSTPCAFTVNGNNFFIARFVRTYTLTTSASPSGGGSVSGGGVYDDGTDVTVTATPNSGYRFNRWSGACTGTGTCSVAMTADRSVTAHFTRTYTLTTSASPSGGGTVSGGGTHDSGTDVTVTATANTGYRFDRWSGACTGTGACSVTMSANRSVTAHFIVRYTLTTSASPSGGGTVSGGGTYDTGTDVTVTASPNSGYRFDRWSGACTGTGACSVTMNAARSVTAHFIARYALTTSASPSGGGSVSGGGTYDAGTEVTVTATASSGYRFDRWSGACTGSGACSVTMNAARSVTAHFTRTYTLTTSASPSGGGSVTGGGTHDAGANVTVTATPNRRYRFDRWSGACTGTGTCSVAMNADRSVTAHFVRQYTVHLRVQPLRGGTATGGGTYDAGTRVTITATPRPGYRFDIWGGRPRSPCYDRTPTGSSCTFTLNGPRIFQVRFLPVFTLTATADPAGGGTVTGGGAYDPGTDVTVTANPNAGYRFDRWSGDCTGSGVCSVNMSAARSVTAHFIARYTLTTSVDPAGGGTISAGGVYDDGTDVTVTASPNSGYRFVRWAGDCTGTGACTVTMSANRAVTAVFVRRYALATGVSPAGGGTVSAGGTYDAGVRVQVTASPNSGYRFDRWSGDCTGSGVCVVTMSAARSVTAHFTRTYTLTTTASPSGGGSLSGGGTHDSGTNVTVTATPGSGYRFDRWSGDCTGSGACSVAMSADRSVTAHFVARHTLTTSVSPSGGGTVSAGGTYDAGTSVTVTATANLGYRFLEWSSDLGGCTGSGACSFTLTSDVTVTARFVTGPVYTLTARASPPAGGTVTGGGRYNGGTDVTVTATANSGYRFSHWTGGACSGFGACSVSMTRNRLVVAVFVARYDLTASADPSAGGTVTIEGSPPQHWRRSTFDAGNVVPVTATPNSGYRFTGWSGDCTGTGACSVTMTADRSVTAHFVRTYTLTTTADPSGGGTLTGGGTHDTGANVTVTASPNSGYRFDRWSGDCTGTGACSVTMTADRSVTAHFTRTYTLATTATPAGGGTVAGAGTYDSGDSVSVVATPRAGYAFERWSGDCTGTGACSVSMTANRSVTAHFTTGSYTVYVRAQPLVGGTVTGGGTYSPGARATIAATPEAGYRFQAWSGAGAGRCGTSTPCSFTVNGNRFFVARFVRIWTLTAAADPSGGGSVSGGGTYDDGTDVTVTATPGSGYRFDRWSGDCTGTGDCEVAMTAARSVTAHFVARYTLTASADPSAGGTVSGGGVYDDGTDVTVTATPNDGYRFERWSGACTGTGTCSVSMTAARSVTAHFVARYTLTTSVSPSAGGTVSAGGTYDAGAAVTVTATANLGYRFLEWTSDLGGCTGSGACSFTMTNDIAVTAHFVVAPVYTLTARATPAAGGTVTGGGRYNGGANVTVTATANSGYRFSHWTGGACSGSGACSVSMTRNRVVIAVFVARYNLRAVSVGSGVLRNPSGTQVAGTYDAGTVVTVVAIPHPGHRFTEWGEACTGTGACTVTMNGDRTVEASFVPVYTLTATASPAGGGTLTGGGTHDEGANVTVTATANSGYRFDRWSGDCTGTGACSVTMNAARSVTAHFVRTYTLTASASPSGGGSVSGGGVHDTGTVVTVTATPTRGYRFVRWSGDCTGSGACSVTMNADRSVTAHFVRTYTVHVRAQPLVGGTVTGGGAYDAGARATIAATPEAGYRFEAWSGGCGTTTPCGFTVNSNGFFIARFVRIWTLTTTASPSGGGTVTGGGVYDDGTDVTVTANPNRGYRFDRWSGDCTGTTCSVTMSANRSVTAHFVRQYTVHLRVQPLRGGTATGAGTYDAGTRVTITATPKPGYGFDIWGGRPRSPCYDRTLTGSSCTFTLNGPRIFQVRFLPIFTLTTSADPSGGGTVTGGGTYFTGTDVTVTANPSSGYRFDRWSGDCTGSGACSVNMSADRSVTAHFIRAWTLTATADPPAGGTVTGGGTYDAGTDVTVTASPNAGYRFARWSGDCTGSGACSVTMSADRSVTAHFTRTWTLTTSASPSGGGRITGAGTYDAGTRVTLSAAPNRGYVFDRWSGDCTGSGTCAVTMSANRSVTAHFVARYTLTASASPSHGGTVTGGGTYAPNSAVAVTASPRAGYRFDRWSGACTGSGTCSVTMTADRSVTAHFVARYTLTTGASPSGGGTVSGGGVYDDGTNVTVTATANLGYRFVEWSGACLGTGACTVTMNGDRAVTATFEVGPVYTLTARAQPAAGGTVTGGGRYNGGTNVTVTATANSGYRFSHWTGGACSGSGACSVSMTRNRLVVAVFVAQYNLRASTFGSGALRTPNGDQVAGTYDAGTVVTVVAIPNPGHRFTEWGEACTGTGACSVTMNGDRTVEATFVPVYTLTTTASPAGGGTLTGGGAYDEGANATVTATPNAGYVFERWSGDCTGTGACSVTMTADRSVTAHFARVTYTVHVRAQPLLGGTVSGGGSYDSGTRVTIAATPEAGYRFEAWSGAGAGRCGTSSPCTFTLSGNRLFIARFVRVHTLTATADPSAGGTVTGGGTHDAGTDVTVTATPNAGYRFDRWSGDCTGTGICAVTMSEDRAVTAHFVRTWTLTATAAPSAGGSVALSPSGGTYDDGTAVTVTATPNDGYRFVRWSGDCTGTGACAVTMTADRSVTAHFIARYTLATSADPPAGGRVSGGRAYGTSAVVSGGRAYDSSAVVAVTATPNAGYRFDRWSGDCTGTGACTVTMSADRSVTAHFVRNAYTLTASASPSHGGTVTGGGAYAPNSAVTVTASPNGGYAFDRWSGACTGSGTCSVTMSADRSVTAHFVARYTLTASASPSGGGTVTGGGTYDDGTNVTVTATANLGYRFREWSGACLGTGACTVTMNADRSVTAIFVAGPVYTLTARASPAAGGTVTGGGRYNGGTDVTVTATANSGYRFSHWTGACSGFGACSVSMTRDRLVVAVFVARYALTASANPSAGGTVTIDVSPPQHWRRSTFDAGSVVTVAATPNSGYRFDRWSGACTGSGTCSVTMTADRSVTAHFVRTYTLTTTADPSGGGTVTGGGTYDSGTNVTVTASPNSGYRFDRWSGDCTGTGACSVAMTADRSVTAHFTRIHTLTVSADPAGGGSVLGGGVYDDGTRVTVTAVPASGYAFDRWSGDCTGTGACSLTMSADRSVTAHFTTGSYTVYVRAQPLVGGTVTGGGTYAPGASATITATPETGYRFQAWSGGCGTSTPCTFTVNGNRVFVARFIRIWTLTADASPAGGGTVTGAGVYDDGTDVTVEATPNAGYRFVRWAGDCTGTGDCEVAMSADRAVAAVFVRRYALATSVSPAGGGTVSAGDTYDAGVRVQVTASPNGGYRFDRWSGDCSGSGVCVVTMSAARSVTAHFTRIWTLTTSASPDIGGSVSGRGVYDTGTDVTVTATPDAGYRFDRWSGDCTGSGTCSVSMTADRAVTAHFVARHTLTTSVSPAGAGSISAGGTHDAGTAVTVTATANLGYRFLEWTSDLGGCTGYGACSFTMTNDIAVTAHFVATPTYTLTARASPAAGGTVTGGGVYSSGAAVAVTASPNGGYRFSHWTGGVCSGSGTCSVSMTRNRLVVAVFVARHTLTANASPSGGGTVTGGGTYDSGTNVTVTASPNSGYRFTGWSGDCTGSGACSVSMSADRSVTANFVARYVLTASASPSGGGTVTIGVTPPSPSRDVTYDAGRVVTVTATPNSGYRFTGWSGDCTGSGACSVTMSADRSVTATFVRTWTLTTTASPSGGGTLTGGGTHDTGANVTVTATPNAGYVFERWSGDCTGTGACSVTMSAARSVTAHFAARHTVHVRAQPLRGGTVTGAGTYAPAARVTITATPEAGYRFEAWSGGCGASSSCTFTVNGNRFFIARFVRTWTLTATASPSGGGTVGGGGTYDDGTDVTVTATPNTGYRFTSWSGACTGTGACEVTMNADRAVTATFVRRYTLTASASPSGGGSVSGGGTYDSGTNVTVTASPNSGYRFDRWSGACTGSGTCSVTMSATRSVTAHFIARYTLTASASPSGGGSLTGGGTYDSGTNVTVTASPNSGYRFDRWSGDCTGSGSCSVTMNAARSVTAHFIARYTLTTSASPSGGGSVSGGGTYDSGTNVTVTATPNSGYRFDRWSGACTGSGSCSVTMNAARSVTAHFIARYTLTTSADPSGGGIVTGGGTYDSGTAVTVTAAPDPGYRFDRWSGACTGSGACSVTMTANRSVTAHFAPVAVEEPTPEPTPDPGPSPTPTPGPGGGGGGDGDDRPTIGMAATARVAGDAPERASFRFRYTCTVPDGISMTDTFRLVPDETLRFLLWAATPCTLTVLDGNGASRISGRVNSFPFTTAAACVFSLDGDTGDLFADRSFTADEYTVEVTFAYGTGTDVVIRLARGFTFTAWPGGGLSIEEALGPLASARTAVNGVYAWDDARQRWDSWFPDAEGLGVNTFTSLRTGGIYVISAAAARSWRVEGGGDWQAPAAVRLARGFTFMAWPGAHGLSIAETMRSLTLRQHDRQPAANAVYFWDAAAQRWLTWFPDADALGVNTLTSFRQGGAYGHGGIYVISAASPLDWRVSDDAIVRDELPIC